MLRRSGSGGGKSMRERAAEAASRGGMGGKFGGGGGAVKLRKSGGGASKQQMNLMMGLAKAQAQSNQLLASLESRMKRIESSLGGGQVQNAAPSPALGRRAQRSARFFTPGDPLAA